MATDELDALISTLPTIGAPPPSAPKTRRKPTGDPLSLIRERNPEFAAVAEDFQKFARERGVPDAYIKSGYRTAKEQNDIFKGPRGRFTKGNDGYVSISPHQDARAIDWSTKDPANRAALHRLIAAFSRKRKLHVPADEPWHMAGAPNGKLAPTDSDELDAILRDVSPAQSGATPSSKTAISPQQPAISPPASLPPAPTGMEPMGDTRPQPETDFFAPPQFSRPEAAGPETSGGKPQPTLTGNVGRITDSGPEALAAYQQFLRRNVPQVKGKAVSVDELAKNEVLATTFVNLQDYFAKNPKAKPKEQARAIAEMGLEFLKDPATKGQQLPKLLHQAMLEAQWTPEELKALPGNLRAQIDQRRAREQAARKQRQQAAGRYKVAQQTANVSQSRSAESGGPDEAPTPFETPPEQSARIRSQGMGVGEMRRIDDRQVQFMQALEQEKMRQGPGLPSLETRLRERGIEAEMPPTLDEQIKHLSYASVFETPKDRRKRVEQLGQMVTAREVAEMSPARKLLHVATGQTGPIPLGGLADVAANLLHFVDTGGGAVEGNKYVAQGVNDLKAFGAYMRGRGDVETKGGAESAVKTSAGFIGQAEKYAIMSPGRVPLWFTLGAEAALENQEKPLKIQALETSKAIVLGLAIEHGPGKIAKALGKMPGRIGKFATSSPEITKLGVATAGFGTAGAVEKAAEGGTTAEIVGAGVGAGVGAALLGAGRGAKEAARKTGRGEGFVGERVPENVRAAAARFGGEEPIFVYDASGRYASVTVDAKTGKATSFRPLSETEITQAGKGAERRGVEVPESFFEEFAKQAGRPVPEIVPEARRIGKETPDAVQERKPAPPDVGKAPGDREAVVARAPGEQPKPADAQTSALSREAGKEVVPVQSEAAVAKPVDYEREISKNESQLMPDLPPLGMFAIQHHATGLSDADYLTALQDMVAQKKAGVPAGDWQFRAPGHPAALAIESKQIEAENATQGLQKTAPAKSATAEVIPLPDGSFRVKVQDEQGAHYETFPARKEAERRVREVSQPAPSTAAEPGDALDKLIQGLPEVERRGAVESSLTEKRARVQSGEGQAIGRRRTDAEISAPIESPALHKSVTELQAAVDSARVNSDKLWAALEDVRNTDKETSARTKFSRAHVVLGQAESALYFARGGKYLSQQERQALYDSPDIAEYTANEQAVQASRVRDEVERTAAPPQVEPRAPAKPSNVPAEEEGRTLTQAVRAAGGISASEINRGELQQFTLREGGKGQLINNKTGRPLEQMAEDMAVEGYGIGVWAEPDRVRGFDVDVDKFVEALAADMGGKRQHYSNRFQPDPLVDQEYEEHLKTEQGKHDADAIVTLLENEGTGQIYDRIVEGKANEADIAEFRKAAEGQFLSPEAAESLIASARTGSISETGATPAEPTAPAGQPDRKGGLQPDELDKVIERIAPAGKTIALNEPAPGDVKAALNRAFYQVTGQEIPDSIFEGSAVTTQQLIDSFAKLGLSDEIMSQSASSLKRMGYVRVGEDVLITDEGLKNVTQGRQTGVEERHAGIPILRPMFSGKSRYTGVDIPDALKAERAEVEARWQAAKGIQRPGVLEKAKEGLTDFVHSFQRTFAQLDPNIDAMHAIVNDELRLHLATDAWSKAVAANQIDYITGDLNKEAVDLLTRNIALPDILKDVDQGLYVDADGAPRELPFGYKDAAEVKADLAKFQELMEANPKIKEAYERRQQLARDLTERLVDLGLLPDTVLHDARYYHRQVLKYFNAKEWIGVSGKDVRLKTKGFQKTRVGGTDFNTRYQEAEFEWMAQAYSLIGRKETLNRISRVANIVSDLRREARKLGEDVDWHDLVPDGYRIWQPKKGNLFYLATTVEERALARALEGDAALSEENLRNILAVGSKKAEWVLPIDIADTLDEFAVPTKQDAVENLWVTLQSTWKQWVLLNPTRFLAYNLNNMSGDMDIALAYAPRILGEYKNAARDLWRYSSGKSSAAVTTELQQALKLGVIDSGLTIAEISDINKAGAFEALVSDNHNIIAKGAMTYWRGVKGFTTWRENGLRLAAFRYFQKKVAAGEKVYGASTKEQVDAIEDPERRAAKLARELIGDYGAVSAAGRWMRRHLIPFYSWVEINTPRYARLLRNTAYEGKTRKTGAAKGAGIVGKNAALFLLKIHVLYLLANAFNHLVFPDEEAQLHKAGREPHIILGRAEDGSIRTLKVQGAFADALEWFGLNDYPSDIMDLINGRKDAEDQVAETIKAPVERFVNSLEPFGKTTFEVSTGKQLYPHFFREGKSFKFASRPIRDRGEYLSRVVSLNALYNRVTGKPVRPASKAWGALDAFLVYRTDPSEAAYWEVRGRVAEFAESKGKESPGPGDPANRQNALYYYKQAVKWGDEKAEARWLGKYEELGGTQKGLEQSVRMSHPLGSLSRQHWQEFRDSLSAQEKEMLADAEEWYEKTFNFTPKPVKARERSKWRRQERKEEKQKQKGIDPARMGGKRYQVSPGALPSPSPVPVSRSRYQVSPR